MRLKQSGGIAGVHGQHGSGDVAAAFAHEKLDHTGDIVGFRQAAQRGARGDLSRPASPSPLVSSVAMKPGATTLTVMPS